MNAVKPRPASKSPDMSGLQAVFTGKNQAYSPAQRGFRLRLNKVGREKKNYELLNAVKSRKAGREKKELRITGKKPAKSDITS